MDIICMGEALIDFTPGKEERSYVCNPGGAPANACIAIARKNAAVGNAEVLHQFFLCIMSNKSDIHFSYLP